jgi:hypothetical protein
MPDSSTVKTAEDDLSGREAAPGSYIPPRLSRVGNVRDLLAGVSGTVPDANPEEIDLQASPQ